MSMETYPGDSAGLEGRMVRCLRSLRGAFGHMLDGFAASNEGEAPYRNVGYNDWQRSQEASIILEAVLTIPSHVPDDLLDRP